MFAFTFIGTNQLTFPFNAQHAEEFTWPKVFNHSTKSFYIREFNYIIKESLTYLGFRFSCE